MSLQYVDVTDLYEAAFLITQGNRIEEIQCIPVSDMVSCRITLAGAEVRTAQSVYENRKACVNVHEFRSAYHQVNSFVHEAKKNYDRQLRQLRKTGGVL